MSIEHDLVSALHEGHPHPEDMPFDFTDAVELQYGPDTGLKKGTVISAFIVEFGPSYSVVL
jgi:hypothetical protein